MEAFHNNEKIKTKYVKRVLNHQKHDRIIQGQGWTGKKGCAVGCTLENYNHKQYEVELGIPEWLARLEDALFEGMKKEDALTWPAKFLKAINVGADLEKVKVPFIVYILEQNLTCLDACKYDEAKNHDVKKAIEGSKVAIKQMIKAQKSGDAERISAAWIAARSAAWSAAWIAARSAERSAESAAWSAARSAESAERSAERSAESAAWSAARSAESAAWSAERSAAYKNYADKLLELLAACK